MKPYTNHNPERNGIQKDFRKFTLNKSCGVVPSIPASYSEELVFKSQRVVYVYRLRFIVDFLSFYRKVLR
jgi:hypothetical protein